MARHTYAAAGDYVLLRVRDNGCGIPEEHIQHLFEPFFTTKEVGQGTGLGLAMVFGAVKRHHGFIEVHSAEGEGTTFEIYLPRLTKVDAEDMPAPARPAPHVRGNQEVILLVDDDPTILNMGTEVLEALGYRVLQAVNGEDALDTFIRHQDTIRLVVSDIVMPRLGGVEAVARMRQIRPELKVIFCTGYDDKTVIHKTDINTKDIILNKPYKINTLSQRVAEALRAP